MSQRTARLSRATNETQIELQLNLDPQGEPQYQMQTGVGFFDHMLDHLARHGRLDLSINATGDRHVDDHHTVEDVGIVLGQALEQALGEKRGIERYGFASVPMDEALARVSIDLSGRPALGWEASFAGERIGTFDTQLVREFFQAVVQSGRFACHVEAPRGRNDHHIAEAIFKAFARALRQAVARTGDGVPSTKGSL